MSTYKNCKVDVVSVHIKLKDETSTLTFERLLTHEDIVGYEFRIKGKPVQYSIEENTDEYIIGFVSVILDKDLPPKVDKKTKKISPLEMTPDEGLGYGNVFLYSKKLDVLFYEVNKNSIYLDSFRELLHKRVKDSEKLKKYGSYDVSFPAILRKEEYKRALNLDIYKSFKIVVRQPKALLSEIQNEHSSLKDKISFMNGALSDASRVNTESLDIDYKMESGKEKGSLVQAGMKNIIKGLNEMIKKGIGRNNLDKIEIKGYDTEYSDKIIPPINLLGDIYYSNFKLENIPRLDTDMQKAKRIFAIKEVFEKEYRILVDYI